MITPKPLRIFWIFWILWIMAIVQTSLINARPQFVEFQADYKNNHKENLIKYSFQYYIDNAPSNVHLNHFEERRGSQVTGQYGLVEPDGLVREVHYQVDGEKGFRSVVRTRTSASRTYQAMASDRNQPKEPVQHARPVAFVL